MQRRPREKEASMYMCIFAEYNQKTSISKDNTAVQAANCRGQAALFPFYETNRVHGFEVV